MSVQSHTSQITLEESIDLQDPGLMVYTIVDDDEPNDDLRYVDRLPVSIDTNPSQEIADNKHLLSSNSSSTSAVRITITDMDSYEGSSMNLTTTALKRSKTLVLKPYLRLLLFVGWRPFGRESYNSTHYGWRVLNIVYPLCIVLLLFYTYIYEVVSCQWKLNINKDTQGYPITPALILPASTIIPNSTDTTQVYNWMNAIPTQDQVSMYNVSASFTPTTSPMEYAPGCDHVVTTYVIPNMLHFIAFILGFFYFRIHENEQLYALMEKVFLQSTPLQGRWKSQRQMIRKLRCFMAFGAVWVLLTMVLQGLFVMAFGIDRTNALSNIGVVFQWFLFSIEMLGIALLNSVNLAVILNHSTQCELLIYYLRGLTRTLQERSHDLRTAMKDILMVRHSISSLNGPMSQMTSLAVVRFGELVFMGLCIVILNKNDDPRIWSYRATFPLVWLIMMIFPLVQAARTNSVCSKFKQIALETRVFGYRNSSQLDLDSFLLFISQTRLRAKLFHIPVRPSYLIGIVVLVSFVLLLLLQTTYIGPTSQYF